MQVYHIYQLLPVLSKKELGLFRSFLKKNGSQGERLLPLYDYVRKFHPDLETEERLDPSAIFVHLYPTVKHSNRKLILNQLSELYTLLMDFLIAQKLQAEPILAEYLQLEILRDRAQTGAYKRRSRQLLEKLEKDPAPNSWDLLLRAKLYEDQLQYNVPETLAALAATAEELLTVLDEGYLCTRYKHLAAQIKFRQFLDKTTPAQAPELPLDHGLLSRAYRLGYLLERNHQEEDFQALMHIFQYSDRMAIPPKDQYELFITLINYKAQQIKLGGTQYLRETLNLYQFGLENGIILQDEGLTAVKFSNIVNLGCSLREFAWTLHFIEKYECYLPAAERKQVSTLASATVSLEQARYQECLDLLANCIFNDPVQGLMARIMALRAQYDHPLRDEEAILQSCRNFRNFLQANRSVKGQNKKAAVNFIDLMRALVRRRKERADLVGQMQSTHPIFAQSWFTSKLASYTKR